MMQKIRVLLAEDQAVVRQGLMALLSSAEDVDVVGTAVDGLEAARQHAALQPDVTLMDLQMPKLGGVGAITQIRAASPEARVIVLTTFDGD
jgi:two-component system NarL family response regulator